jgi:hypothetical protein
MVDLGYEPDDWQTRLLRSQSKRVLLLCGRQLGKSTVVAIKALHTACFTDWAEVLLISVGQRQAELLFDKVLDFYKRLSPVPAVKMLATELELANGSKVLALPGDPRTIRGYTPALILLDEASRADEGVLAATTPMLAESDGVLMALSTPHGRRGFFYRTWTDESQTWERISARRIDYPHRVRPGFLEEELKTLGPALFRQEHENEFIEDGDQIFAYDDIMAMRQYPSGVLPLSAIEGL